ncbi:MAG: tRNA (N(6)-L-threonylcarbamoyladenosine(37)-C(2))-methylthiotransferase MtaB [Bacilli bacterium]
MTFHILTLGCKINSYESESIREKMVDLGYLESKTAADIFIVNTCAVTKTAENKDLKAVRDISRDYPNSRIFVMGCSSQIHKEKYLAIKGVTGVYGTGNRLKVFSCLKEKEEADNVNPDWLHFIYEEMSIRQGEHLSKATIKIQDGCSNYCSYCIVPYSRGISRCRKHEWIIKEAKELLSSSTRELVIGGIDVGSYTDPEDSNYHLSDLLNELAHLEISDEFRIRVSSIEASQIDDNYIQVFKDNPQRLCPHFHMPLQSGSQHILGLMNRKYSLDDFYAKVLKIKEAIPHAALSTDVISGFPGETDEDFEMTCSFIRKVGFMRIHAFPYSEREGTPAARIKQGVVPMSVRKERTRKLISLSAELDKQYRESLEGLTMKVLIESQDKEGFFHGYTENYLEEKLVSKKNILNSFVTIKK